MDTNMILRTGATNLTADETLTTICIGPMNRPMWIHVVTDAASEASDTLDVEIELCTAAATTTQVANINCPQMDVSVDSVVMNFPFFAPPGLTYAQVKLNITDNDAGGDFNAGGVKVWIDNSGRYDGPYDS